MLGEPLDEGDALDCDEPLGEGLLEGVARALRLPESEPLGVRHADAVPLALEHGEGVRDGGADADAGTEPHEVGVADATGDADSEELGDAENDGVPEGQRLAVGDALGSGERVAEGVPLGLRDPDTLAVADELRPLERVVKTLLLTEREALGERDADALAMMVALDAELTVSDADAELVAHALGLDVGDGVWGAVFVAAGDGLLEGEPDADSVAWLLRDAESVGVAAADEELNADALPPNAEGEGTPVAVAVTVADGETDAPTLPVAVDDAQAVAAGDALLQALLVGTALRDALGVSLLDLLDVLEVLIERVAELEGVEDRESGGDFEGVADVEWSRDTLFDAVDVPVGDTTAESEVAADAESVELEDGEIVPLREPAAEDVDDGDDVEVADARGVADALAQLDTLALRVGDRDGDAQLDVDDEPRAVALKLEDAVPLGVLLGREDADGDGVVDCDARTLALALVLAVALDGGVGNADEDALLEGQRDVEGDPEPPADAVIVKAPLPVLLVERVAGRVEDGVAQALAHGVGLAEGLEEDVGTVVRVDVAVVQMRGEPEALADLQDVAV